MVKKRGFWKNASLKRGEALPMLRYLNKMSARGLHIKRLNRFKNEFEENKDERYLYAICRPETEDYYKEVDGWERLFEYRSLVFYGKRFPREFVSIKKPRLYKRPMKERLWLNERLKEGLLLFGKTEGEYIFERYDVSERAEYFTDYIPRDKDPDVYLYEKALEGFECVSPSTDGTTYYFVKREGKGIVRGLKNTKNRERIKKRRMCLSLAALILICAAFAALSVLSLRFGKGIRLCLTVGAPLTLISLLAFLIFKRSYVSEKKRRMKEERGLSSLKEKEDKAEAPKENNNEGIEEAPGEPGKEQGEERSEDQIGENDEKKPDSSSDTEPFGLSVLPLTTADDSDEWCYIDENDDAEEECEESEPPTRPFQPEPHKNGTVTESKAPDRENDAAEAMPTVKKAESEDQEAFGGFLRYQLISSIFFLTVYCAGAAVGITYTVRYFAFEKRDSLPLLILGIAVTALLPLVLYNGIGAIRMLTRQIKSKKQGQKNKAEKDNEI